MLVMCLHVYDCMLVTLVWQTVHLPLSRTHSVVSYQCDHPRVP